MLRRRRRAPPHGWPRWGRAMRDGLGSGGAAAAGRLRGSRCRCSRRGHHHHQHPQATNSSSPFRSCRVVAAACPCTRPRRHRSACPRSPSTGGWAARRRRAEAAQSRGRLSKGKARTRE
eukprot:scaffold95526_cov63-Phaeocystis_antarctica.AAC.2